MSGFAASLPRRSTVVVGWSFRRFDCLLLFCLLLLLFAFCCCCWAVGLVLLSRAIKDFGAVNMADEERRARTGSADAWTHYRATSTTEPPEKGSMASLPADAEEAKNDGE